MKPLTFSPPALREARLRRAFTPEDLVVALRKKGVPLTTRTLHSWESGKTTPKANALSVLATVLGITMVDLFTHHKEGR